MPELRHLRAFVAVAEQLSFTRAAELLHLTQQTVSRTVGELERELGVTLLERTTREVRLTAAGASLLRDGVEVVRAADAAFTRAREIGTGALGRVRIGVSPAIGPLDRDDVVRALRPPGSDISLALHEVRPADLRPLLRAHELDLALTRVSGERDETLHSARLRPTPMVLAVPAHHPLAARASLTLRDLDGCRLLVASARGTSYTDLLVDAVEAAGASVEVVEARVTGGAAFLTPLAEEDAVALMPAGTPPRDGVAIVAVEAFTVPLVLLWPAGLPSAAVGRLRAALS
ncbi:LysR family transcriptional regulator [Solirubrobacter ginsenosidimutans]|uniref:LysR family transcriptional regulator n=1 Tax=Solirubrobacter ginsenosidimutans TaxID=490573 RepID=A0A9X3MWW8_9ACTN|nr:LysR substrate-binding domain-containing protein [Solirubrobacter ginsenosidimutans]MDA0164304.1 LysR family transcriptional regulator [Solirubrobacter ginsenosidimutans]